MDEELFWENIVPVGHINEETLKSQIYINNINFSTLQYDETVLPTELECCYNEFKYYQKSNNEIATLGWAISYQLQVLWQNSPKIDTIQNYHLPVKQNKPNNPQAEQRLKEIQNFLQSKGIEPLILHYTPYPNNTQTQEMKRLRQNSERFSRHVDNKTNEVREERRSIKFYTTLDWDKFYSHFPIIKRLSKKFHTKEDIYTQNFTKQIEIILQKTHNILILKNLPQGEYKFDFAIDIKENRSDKNEESYIIIKENDEISKDYKRILDCKPYELDTLNCQYIGVGDDEFFRQIWQNLGINIAEKFKVDFSYARLDKFIFATSPFGLTYNTYETLEQAYDELMQDLSLYACSGKFSFNFVPSKLSIKKEIQGDREKVSYRVDEMLVYVYDSFDFLDQGHEFDDDGNFIKLGQPVGAWDFNEKSFSIWGSTRQMRTYSPKWRLKCIPIPKITFEDILQSPKTKQYYLYNQDYQDYQKFTPYGLDFRLYSKDFITKLDFKDKAYNVLYNTGV
ncbi:hypothetical protein RYF92_001872 [Campylobacter jejuni]|nr:hypothetical protein [Campylobacter jejuni]EAH6784883.1 hypothetical protein [Campylobacter jejuni]EAI3058419.1 hypothetical protein [Campylobacter jejuni]EAI5187761.1 hypothetical protein [Campylobacter jejuni]EAI5821522.1 hypothetical protein [Campylobacter jejuni]